jgi:hypothetical protein
VAVSCLLKDGTRLNGSGSGANLIGRAGFGFALQRADNDMEFVSFVCIEASCQGWKRSIQSTGFSLSRQARCCSEHTKATTLFIPCAAYFDLSCDSRTYCSKLANKASHDRWFPFHRVSESAIYGGPDSRTGLEFSLCQPISRSSLTA